MSQKASRDLVLGVPFTRTVTEYYHEGVTYRIRNLTAGENNTEASKHLACDDEDRRAQLLASLPARYVAQQVVDDNGYRIFSDLDVVKLLDKGSDWLSGLAEICQKHNGKKDVASAEKNLGQIPNLEPPT